MSLQPVYGKKAKIVMWIDIPDDGFSDDDQLTKGEFHLAHVLRRYYDWQGTGTGTHRRMGYFTDYEALYSTLQTWNKKFPDFIFALNIQDENTNLT